MERLDGKGKVTVVSMDWEGLCGNACVVSEAVLKEDIFTTLSLMALDTVIQKGEFVKTEPANLFDDAGIRRVGSVVSKGDVLVNKYSATTTPMGPEDKLLNAIFGVKKGEYPLPFTYPFLDKGIVVESKLEPKHYVPEKAVKIYCGIKRDLAIGDILEDPEGRRLVVAKIVSAEKMPWFWKGEVKTKTRADVVVGPDAGLNSLLSDQRILFFTTDGKKRTKAKAGTLRLMKTTHQLEDKITARSIGDYSTTNLLPITAHERPKRAQKIKMHETQAMATAGLPINLKEIHTVKAAARENRGKLFESLVKGKRFDVETIHEVPANVVNILNLLKALCLDPQISKGTIKIAPLSQEAVLKQSCGAIKRSETHNYRTMKPWPGGIFCEKIFGPEKDYECACGKYSRIKFKGKICERCGVEVTDSLVRRTRFGHIESPIKLIHPFCYKAVAEELSITENEVMSIAHHKRLISSDTEKPVTIDEVTTSGERALSGAEALAKMLENKNKDRLLLIGQNLPVLPAGQRPLVPLPEKNQWATSDLNDLYRRVIDSSARLKRLIELKAPHPILLNESRMLQEAVDQLFDNEAPGRVVHGPGDRPLQGLMQQLVIDIKQVFDHGVDYSGSFVVVPDATLEADKIKLPLLGAQILFMPFLIQNLVATGQALTIKNAKNKVERDFLAVIEALPTVLQDKYVLAISRIEGSSRISAFKADFWGEEAVAMHPQALSQMGFKVNGDKAVIHLPVTSKTQKEAERFLFPKVIEALLSEKPKSVFASLSKEFILDNLTKTLPLTELDTMLV